MRILHVTDASAAGVLAAITSLARAQSEHPDVTSVRVCYTPRPESPTHETIVRSLGTGVEARRWSNKSRTAVLGLVRGLLRELRDGRFDVIHLHSSRAGFFGRLLARVLRADVRVVYSPHGFAFDRSDFSTPAAAVFLGMERLALHGSRSLVLVSEGEAAVARTKLPQADTAVLPNVVDSSAFSRAHQAGEAGVGKNDGDVLRVVHIGRIMGQKRPEMFAEVASHTHRTHPGRFEFVWIGDGDRTLLRRGTGTPPVQITGWVTSDELRTHLSQAAIMLFTSSGEGMPISLLEASSMGIPTVGWDVVGVRDLVADRTDGFLVSTVDEAVAALGELLDVSLRRSFGAAARDRVINHHSRADLGDQSVQIYNEFGHDATEAPLEHMAEKTAVAPSVVKLGRRSS